MFFWNLPKIFPQMYASETNENTTNIDYSKLTLYTYGERVWVITDENNTPIQELYGEWETTLAESETIHRVQFSNHETENGSVIDSGVDLITKITIIQNSCVLWNSVIPSGQSIQAYQTQSVPYLSTCQSITRTCSNGTLLGDTSYRFDSCIVQPANNCESTHYNGYSIPSMNHNETQTISKTIAWWEEQIQVSCNNGTLSYGTQSTTCTNNYVLDNGECKQDICTGDAPPYSQTNGTQQYNTNWTHNTTPWVCTFVCQAWYYYNNWINTCIEASVWHYVATTWQTTQTACTSNDTYQDQSGQTNCKTVQNWYYSTPEWTNPKTWQSECEANHYCTNWVKTSCPVWTNSPAWSTHQNQCQSNVYDIIWNISNGNWATIQICWLTTTADTSGNFHIHAEHGTPCNNLTISRTNYTCSITSNGPSTLTSNISVSGNCVANPSCWSANGTATTTAPSTNLCSAWTASAVTTNTGNFTWTCSSTNGGTTSSCSASRQYTVTFNGNWATSWSMSAQNITANTSANLTTNWFTRTWHTFLWWNTNQSATTATHTNGASYSMGTANVILYAIWQSSWSCWKIVLWPNWEEYNTILWLDWKCWTSTNMKHAPTLWNHWCYSNNLSNCDTQGRLYDWIAATHLSVCPILGTWWALPTDTQWTTLTNAWATWWRWNKLGDIVSVLPGYRLTDGTFTSQNTNSYRWSSTQYDSTFSRSRRLNSFFTTVNRDNINKAGWLSVVCIKN